MDLQDFVEIKWKEIKAESIVITNETKLWCRYAYPGHPDGCPNRDSDGCRKAPKFDPAPYNYFYLIYAMFDIDAYRKEKAKLPTWENAGDKALGNSRHWQSTIKKMLKDKIKHIYKINKNTPIYVMGSGSGFTYKEMKLIQDTL